MNFGICVGRAGYARLFFVLVRLKCGYDVAENDFDSTGTFDGIVLSEVLVEFLQGCCLLVVNIEAFADGIKVIVGTSGAFAAFNHALYQFILVNLKTNNGMNVRSIAFEHFGEGLCLGNCAGESVENHAFGSIVCVFFEFVFQNFNHHFVGDELTVGDIAVGELADVCSFCDMVAQEFTGRDVMQAVFFNQFFALGTLSAAGSTEYYYIHDFSVFFQYINVVQVTGFFIKVKSVPDDEFLGDIKSDVVGIQRLLERLGFK